MELLVLLLLELLLDFLDFLFELLLELLELVGNNTFQDCDHFIDSNNILIA